MSNNFNNQRNNHQFNTNGENYGGERRADGGDQRGGQGNNGRMDRNEGYNDRRRIDGHYGNQGLEYQGRNRDSSPIAGYRNHQHGSQYQEKNFGMDRKEGYEDRRRYGNQGSDQGKNRSDARYRNHQHGSHINEKNSGNRQITMAQLSDRIGMMNLRGPGQINHPPNQPIGNIKPDIVNIAKKELLYKSQEFADRPEKLVFDMKIGRKTEVVTNYAPLLISREKLQLTRYNISFFAIHGKIEKPIVKRDITGPRFWDMIHQYPGYFPTPELYIFNDVNIMYVDIEHALKDAEKVLWIRDDRKKVIGKVEIVSAKYSDPTNDEEITGIVDSIATAVARRDPLRSDFLSSKTGIFVRDTQADFPQPIISNLPSGFQVLTGLHMGVKMNLRGGPMVNLDLAHSVYTHPKYSVIRLLCEYSKGALMDDEEFERYERNALPRMTMSTKSCIDVSNMLHNKLMKTYIPGRSKNPIFKFQGFYMDDGKVVTAINFQFNHTKDGISRRYNMVEYYQEVYHYSINPNFPVAQAPQKKKTVICYPLESLQLHESAERLGGTIHPTLLNQMVKSISYPPEVRLAILRELADQQPNRQTPALIDSDQGIMKHYGVEIGRKLVKANAVVLQPPTLAYGGGKRVCDGKNDGEWDTFSGDRTLLTLLSNQSVVSEKEMVILPLMIKVPQDQREEWTMDQKPFDSLMKTIASYGITVVKDDDGKGNEVRPPRATFVYRNDYVALTKWLEMVKMETAKFQQTCPQVHVVPLIICVFEKRCTTMKNARFNIHSDYGFIKEICNGQMGIQVQGLLYSSYNRIEHQACSICHNLALKIFGKIGAIHFKLVPEGKNRKYWETFTNKEDPTLVLSIDVTHPSCQALKNGAPHEKLSVASIVGNIDIEMTRFKETCRVQNPGQEQVVNMIGEIQERITDFANFSRIKPGHIVIYRDGIGETDFQRILYEELANIKMAVQNMGFDTEPTITYIVVTKRHHTRLFGIHKEDCNGMVNNLRPGVMVEDTITHNKYFDFYLLSHHGPIGTSRPAHYYVLHDTWAPSAAFWQTITFALCYNYCRQARSLSQPGPLMYAHLAAARAKDRLNAIVRLWDHQGREFNIGHNKDVADLNEAMKNHESLEGMLFV